VRPRRDAWWKYARAFQQMPENTRRADVPNHHVRSHLARIARLPPSIGEALDRRKAPMRVYRFIAYAPDSAAVPLQLAQKARGDGVIEFLARTGRWPLPRQMREIDQAVRSRWSGMGPAKAPKTAPAQSPPAAQVAPAAPQPAAARAPQAATAQPAAPRFTTAQPATTQAAAAQPAPQPATTHVAPPSPAQSALDAVARQDPQLAATLVQLATNRTTFGR
jgi:hypothetical protein